MSFETIPKLQKTHKSSLVVMEALCMISGGQEIIALCVVTLIWGRRSKFFYYLVLFA